MVVVVVVVVVVVQAFRLVQSAFIVANEPTSGRYDALLLGPFPLMECLIIIQISANKSHISKAKNVR